MQLRWDFAPQNALEEAAVHIAESIASIQRQHSALVDLANLQGKHRDEMNGLTVKAIGVAEELTATLKDASVSNWGTL